MKKILLCVLLMAFTVVVYAHGSLTARARVEMSKNIAFKSRRAMGCGREVRCFVRVSDEHVLRLLASRGVRINGRFGDYAVVQMPLGKVASVAAECGVRSLSLPVPMELSNDSARYYGNVDAVHSHVETPSSCTGKGVIVGIIDTGVDFNHINFQDANGHTRIKRVYMPQDSTGVSPVIDGDTLPGSHYTTAAQIALLTTDNPAGTHGTHTAGTAAGSYRDNGYYGIAPDADIVMCSMPQLYDTDIACAIKYIDNYARSVGKPAVINMSFASQEGAHDGSSALCKIFDNYSSAGHICVISAGNSARERIYLQRKFNGTATDTLRTYIDNYSSSTSYRGYISSWSASSAPHLIGISVIDKTTHAQVAALPMFALTDSALTLSLDSIPELSPYLSGELFYAWAIEDNGRFHSVIETDVRATEPSRYRLGVRFISAEKEIMRAWSSGVIMINDASIPGYTSAVRSSCISDLATGDKAISVGAYCTKRFIPSVSGGTYDFSRSTPQDIAYFSSYGPDARGISRPDVCAPGAAIVSSGSRYYSSWSATLSSVAVVDGVEYPYYGSQGTSMSAPVVTGTLALWLERYPHLTPDDVRAVLAATCVRDSYVASGNPELWGFGKIDALAGLRFIEQNFPIGLDGDVNGDGIVDVDDVNAVINIILGKATSSEYIGNPNVNDDDLVDLDDVNAIVNIILCSNVQ